MENMPKPILVLSPETEKRLHEIANAHGTGLSNALETAINTYYGFLKLRRISRVMGDIPIPQVFDVRWPN